MPLDRDPWSRKICVYRAHGPADGHFMRDLLVSSGIPVEMRGELLSSLQGAIPLADSWPSLWVVPHNEARARSIIDSLDAAPSGAGWACGCGETNASSFGSCWACGRDRPGLGQGEDPAGAA